MAKRISPLTEQEKRSFNKKNFTKLTRIFRFLLPYKYTFAIGFVFLLVSSTTLLAFPLVSGKLIDAASGKDNWYIHGINSIAIALLLVLLVQSIFSFFRVYFFAQVSERGMADVRLTLYQKMMGLPLNFFDTRRTGELISRITADVSLLQDTFSITLAEFIRQFSTLIIGTAVIFYITPQLTLFMLGSFPFIIVAAMVFGKYIRKLARKTQDELATANIIVEETLQSIHTVKAFTSEIYETARYGKSLKRVVKVALKAATFRGAFISFIIFALFGGIVGVMWYGASLVHSGAMTVGDLLSFVLYTTFIGGSIAGLGDLYGQIQRAIGASERVLEIIEEKGEQTSMNTDDEMLKLDGSISYRNVSFAYPTRHDIAVLKGINFEVKPGEKVALVGQSGAGKSTIVQLLMRFYQVEEGEILVDGKNIREYSLRGLRKQIGIVPQEILLFGGTIRENIGYGNPEAGEEEIVEAAKKANAYDFIQSFPEGMETMVGERGIKLSGGQRQRIAIARAILKNPTILVLDEATSSLDAESEYLVQSALEKLMEGRTTIVIAHRLATIRKVDKIFVIKDGVISESGSHEELASQEKGTYSNLVKLQFETK